jgi:hypothetical protein
LGGCVVWNVGRNEADNQQLSLHQYGSTLTGG